MIKNCGPQIDWATITISIILSFFGWGLYTINGIDQQLKETLVKFKEFDDTKDQIQSLSTSGTEILTTVRTIQALNLSKPEPATPVLKPTRAQSAPPILTKPERYDPAAQEPGYAPPAPKPTLGPQRVPPIAVKPERYDPAKLADFSVRHKISQPQYNLILKSLNTQSKDEAKNHIEGIITDQNEVNRLFAEIY
jgi:hypothetical protein